MQNKLIIFDIDGTLTNTTAVDAICFKKAVFEVLSISSINTDWYSYKYSTDAGIVKEIIQTQLNRDPHPNEIEFIRDKFFSHLTSSFLENISHCAPIEGSQIVFSKIFSLGWDIGIATGGWQKTALLKLNTAQIPYQNIPIAHSDDHIERVNIISIAVDRAKIFYQKQNYSKIIYVGDKFWDKRAAESLNIDFIGIGSEFESIEEKNFCHINNYTDSLFENYLSLI